MKRPGTIKLAFIVTNQKTRSKGGSYGRRRKKEVPLVSWIVIRLLTDSGQTKAILRKAQFPFIWKRKKNRRGHTLALEEFFLLSAKAARIFM